MSGWGARAPEARRGGRPQQQQRQGPAPVPPTAAPAAKTAEPSGWGSGWGDSPAQSTPVQSSDSGWGAGATSWGSPSPSTGGGAGWGSDGSGGWGSGESAGAEQQKLAAAQQDEGTQPADPWAMPVQGGGWGEENLGNPLEELIKNQKPLTADNPGWRMLEQMGWKPGTGIGKDGRGTTEVHAVEWKGDRKGLAKKAAETGGLPAATATAGSGAVERVWEGRRVAEWDPHEHLHRLNPRAQELYRTNRTEFETELTAYRSMWRVTETIEPVQY
eukprot:TRINITY_DN5182_c1_g1_i1.p1 TRINITY_DN5182_c1_g1~~TRINITY_DN5182_c1_g1_i1.p1  ORF type:complete len:273 (+),score=43.29 TRINITY_DN5182_c1_g1_i1:40-858(+)